jgi:hypothetical protein
VGYGDIVPQTTKGKWFSIVYIVLGVTVMVGVLSYIVSLVASLRKEQEAIGKVRCTQALLLACTYPCLGSDRSKRLARSRYSPQVKLPTLRSIFLDALWAVLSIVITVALGTVFCTCYKPMGTSVLDGIYLCIVTLTTVVFIAACNHSTVTALPELSFSSQQ